MAPRQVGRSSETTRLASHAVSGFGSDFGCFGERSAATPAALTSPFLSRWRRNDRIPASPRPSVRAPAPSRRRLARKARRSAGRRSLISEMPAGRRMAGQELQELPGVALIGIDGQRGQPTLAASASARPARACRRSGLAEMRNSCIDGPPRAPRLESSQSDRCSHRLPKSHDQDHHETRSSSPSSAPRTASRASCGSKSFTGDPLALATTVHFSPKTAVSSPSPPSSPQGAVVVVRLNDVRDRTPRNSRTAPNCSSTAPLCPPTR